VHLQEVRHCSGWG